ncbi:hypothetical protein V2O64_11665 [Verrucomicrobiaceae bacterium 227]
MTIPLLPTLRLLFWTLLLTHLSSAQTIYEQLKLRNPLPTPNHLNIITELNGKWIAAGEYGTILSSTDAQNWTLHPTGYDKSITDVAYGNGIYLALGSDNRHILTSPDLETWTIDRPANVPFNPKGILFRSGKFWLVGSDSSVCTSLDGLTWEQSKIDDDFRFLRGLSYGGGLYMVIATDAYIATSPDGITWTERPTGITFEDGNKDSFLSSQYLNGRYVIGGAEGTLLSSPDAVTWTQHPTPSESWVFDVKFYDGNYYLLGRGKIYRSPDLETWEEIPTDANDDFYQMHRKDGINTMVGRQGAIFTSSDLTNWTDRRSQTFESADKVRFLDGKFYLSNYSDTLYQSSDTLTWEVFHQSDLTIYDFIYADGKWVTIGSKGEISQSVDGVIWGPSTPQFEGFPGVQGIRFLNGKWYLFGRSGFLRVSENLNDWTVADPDDTTLLNDLIFANGLYVAVGNDGKIFTSSDGVNFVVRETGTDRDFRTVAFGNNTFVAAGVFFQPFVSSDGVTWSNEGVSGAPSLNQLAFQDGLFVGVGFNGSVAYGQDGKDWTTIQVGLSNGLNSVAAGNDRLVVIGSGGLIMSTDPLPQRSLTLTTTGTGTIQAQPLSPTYLDGSFVTITATAGDGTAFSGWSGDATGMENPLTVTMDADKTITANFVTALVGYDLWRASEFNAAERGNDAISGKTADPDNDGRNNLTEYYLSSRPKSPDPSQFLSFRTVDLGGGIYPVVSYQRRKNAPDVTERVEISNDLFSWRHNGNSPSNQTLVFSLDNNGDGTETVSYRTQALLSSAAKTYFRIIIE